MALAVLLIIGTFAFNLSVQNPQQAASRDNGVTRDTTRFERVFMYGLQGKVADGLIFLDSLEGNSLTPRQSDLRKKYYARFRIFDEHFRHKSTDTAVRRLTEMYLAYWRQGLLDNAGIPRYDTMLADSVSRFLRANDTALAGKSNPEIQDDFPQFLSEFLQKRGVFSAVGKTGQLFDLLLHTRETEAIYEVTTPEETVSVKVVLMENTISNGWEEYATFGKYSPGGWATDEALYCVRETYDTASENFKISYLKHEGKHFADYKRFPKLVGTDLEYRAKLVELSAAQTSLFDLIRSFELNSSTDRSNPHAFANHCALRDLAVVCDVGDVSDMAKWKSMSPSTINSRAAALLKQNSIDLSNAGADTVTTIIR